eukprot:gnl/TRDRNA2_/TRDRNA2_181232_c0_seq1.p2 gnl/TRDRNA2_/TRDRNA2_181232_c0~~gnl/TRDRNA2_/TRDRNA2_181232_c0_seq1.p2  ORF type:complete len:393 (-),score=108.62 gnl/TRDRNA2_/TRDRNA2_181232_c0_seq1:69-1247(-)
MGFGDHVGDGPVTKEMVLKAALDLGMDPVKEEQLMWIAEHAVRVQLPSDWTQFEDDDGQKVYYQPKTKRLTTQHPILTKYQNFLQSVRKLQERTGTINKKVKPHLAVVLNEVLNRVNRELPPSTPEIIERLAVLLQIDSSIEHTLTRRLKAALEVYAEDQYDLAVQAHSKADMDTFLNEIRSEQIRIEVLQKPEDVIMCTEIENQPARVKCEQCKDFFSLEGFSKTHQTGKRMEHTTVKCEQVTCSVYTDQLATVEVDNVLFCDKAYDQVASRRPEIRQKRKKVLGGLPCSEIPQRVAEVLCEDCSDLYSWEAFIQLHRRGNRIRHIPLRVDEEGQLYRAGTLLSADETARLVDRARFAREGGPWLAFQDDQLNTYWYHLSDKVTTTQNPYL